VIATKLLSPIHPHCHSALSHTASSVWVSEASPLQRRGQIAGIDELDLEIHFVKENVIVSQDARSFEKFMHGIKVLMSGLLNGSSWNFL